MRLLHTSDWHLGHSILSLSREREHQAFLDWLVPVLDSEQIDALLITGDIFDTANPSGAAQRLWYEFLERAHRLRPAMAIVVIGGNHDSATRLDAPEPLLRAHNVHVVGGLPLDAAGQIDMDRLVIPLRDSGGAVRSWCAAVPFLRPCDLPVLREEGDPLKAGVEAIYRQAFAALRERRSEGQAMIATGHLYLSGSTISELSERKILGGNLHALEGSLFPGDLAYAALGHLHLAQQVGGRPEVRYAGSPLPLSVGEAHYPHQVVVVELEGERVAELRKLPVPRAVEFITLPEEGAASPEVLEQLIGDLAPRDDSVPIELRPFLHVRVTRRVPDHRSQLERLLEDRSPRLVTIKVVEDPACRAGAAAVEPRVLESLNEEEVFRRCYQERHGEAPPDEVLRAFLELVAEAQHQ